MDGPAGVAEEPLDLPENMGNGEGRELRSAGEVEPVDGLDEADGADLDDVLHLVTVTSVPRGHIAHQRQVHLDERIAGVLILGSALVEFREPLEEQRRQCLGVLGATFPASSTRGSVVEYLPARGDGPS